MSGFPKNTGHLDNLRTINGSIAQIFGPQINILTVKNGYFCIKIG